MKKYTIWIKVLLPVVILSAMLVTVFATPALRRVFLKENTQREAFVPDAQHRFSETEKAQLSSIFRLYAHLDSCTKLYISGVFSAVDHADSLANISQEFIFSRNGNEFYYKIGSTEMISLADAFITISHDAGKIIVSRPKKLAAPFQLPMDTLFKVWDNENYRVHAGISKGDSVVSLTCANHATCKEYRFVFNPETLSLKENYMRLTNLRDPFNPDMDKEVHTVITLWKEDYVNGKILDMGSYLSGSAPQWTPAGAYKDYKLVNAF
ncbi:hypothetical protein [Chitinophaga solisilvae]|uniref:hypothetical protein n=1 Tax=Chitinophaga solisilvae TaxID=1233460 RepID=UPI001368CBFC|nr:hypothetical protein [Chitinophaga solisilvae]